jgi:hypothetical protein
MIDKQVVHCLMVLSIKTSLNQKPKTSFIGSRISHLDAFISMKHIHPSYTHIVFQMSFTSWVKFEPKFYAKSSVN